MGTICFKCMNPIANPISRPPLSSSAYRLTDDVIGYGSFSQVQVACDPYGKPFAIKCIRIADFRCDRSLVEREISILERLKHPGIVSYIGYFEDPEWAYIVTELCEGGNLMEKISKRGTLPETELRAIAKSILPALKYIHSLKLCHRDLKPENILFTKCGTAKISDFGLASDLHGNQTMSVVGTPFYLAPEVLEGTYSNKCDMWSFGVVLYYAAVGHQPFGGTCWEEFYDNMKSGEIHDWGKVGIDEKFFLMKLLQIDPKKRLSAAEAMRDPWVDQLF